MTTNDLTPEQDKESLAMFQDYEARRNAIRDEIQRLRPDDQGPMISDADLQNGGPQPTEDEVAQGEVLVDGKPVLRWENMTAYRERQRRRSQEINDIRKRWEAEGSAEWRAAKAKEEDLRREYFDKKTAYIRACQEKNFADLHGDREKILDDARQIAAEEAMSFAPDDELPEIFPFDGTIDDKTAVITIKSALRRHYDFFAGDAEATELLDNIITTALKAVSKKAYRTRKRTKNAAEYPIVENVPDGVPVITLKGYEGAMSLSNARKSNAFMQLVKYDVSGLDFSNGTMSFPQIPNSQITLQDIITKEGIDKIDLFMLRSFYGVILKEFEESGGHVEDVYHMYIPDFAKLVRRRPSITAQEWKDLEDEILRFQTLLGIFKDGSKAPVLLYMGYDAPQNTFAFSSPYMTKLIRELRAAQTRKDKTGKVLTSKDGAPKLAPAYSYLITPSINTERNAAAKENVAIIVQLIEQCGNNVPEIRAKTLINRNALLKDRLRDSSNPNQLLKRCFTATWKILRSCTRLSEVYKDIKLPDPNDPAQIPTPSTLDAMKFAFPHNGKCAEHDKTTA